MIGESLEIQFTPTDMPQPIILTTSGGNVWIQIGTEGYALELVPEEVDRLIALIRQVQAAAAEK